jgi:hypothetical protein
MGRWYKATLAHPDRKVRRATLETPARRVVPARLEGKA